MIKRGYLRKKGGQWRSVRLMDLVVLLYHVHKGANMDEVGFEDALETIDSLTRRLNQRVLIDPNLLESALWSCNMLDEREQFWHPKNKNFDDFVRELLGRDGFDKTYNLIQKRD